MAHEAPGLLAQSTEMAANAQAMAAAQQAVAPTAPLGAPASAGGSGAPIAGVSLELYVEISKSFAEVGYDQSRGPELAARRGVDAPSWAAALDGWNARIAADPAVASRFNALYTGR